MAGYEVVNCDIIYLVRNCNLCILCLEKKVSPTAECGCKIKYFYLFDRSFASTFLNEKRLWVAVKMGIKCSVFELALNISWTIFNM